MSIDTPAPPRPAANPLERWLTLVWGPQNPALEPWREAMDAYRRVWLGSLAPVAPPVSPAPPVPTSPPFRTHAPGTPLDGLSVGDSASTTRRITQADIDAFARISGDDNPAHVNADWAAASPLGGRVAHGMLTAGLISAVLGTQLPGPGAIYMSQTLKWLAPVRPDDLLTATVTVRELVAGKNRVVLDTVVRRGEDAVLVGQALVMPPRAGAGARSG